MDQKFHKDHDISNVGLLEDFKAYSYELLTITLTRLNHRIFCRVISGFFSENEF